MAMGEFFYYFLKIITHNYRHHKNYEFCDICIYLKHLSTLMVTNSENM